jgi:hypothetical protein
MAMPDEDQKTRRPAKVVFRASVADPNNVEEDALGKNCYIYTKIHRYFLLFELCLYYYGTFARTYHLTKNRKFYIFTRDDWV